MPSSSSADRRKKAKRKRVILSISDKLEILKMLDNSVSNSKMCEKPLQPPYDGPFPVLSRSDKHFTVKLNGRTDTISIDRLKPAHCETEQPPNTSAHSSSRSRPDTASPTTTPTSNLNSISSARTTRSGRHVHFPTYLSRYVS